MKRAFNYFQQKQSAMIMLAKIYKRAHQPEDQICQLRHCDHCGACLDPENETTFCDKKCYLWSTGVDTIEEYRGER